MYFIGDSIKTMIVIVINTGINTTSNALQSSNAISLLRSMPSQTTIACNSYAIDGTIGCRPKFCCNLMESNGQTVRCSDL